MPVKELILPARRNAGRRTPGLRGFTLVELLVSIGLVVILAAVAIMLTSKAGKKTSSLRCVQNLRDWSLVFANSASDNNGRLPTPANWASISHLSYDPDRRSKVGRSPFVDYWDADLNRAFEIQLEKRSCPCHEAGLTPSGNPGTSYMMNRQLSEGSRKLEIRLAGVRQASRKVIFIDGTQGCPLELKSASQVSRWIEPAAKHHGGTVNAVFADLHVASLHPQELKDRWQEHLLP